MRHMRFFHIFIHFKLHVHVPIFYTYAKGFHQHAWWLDTRWANPSVAGGTSGATGTLCRVAKMINKPRQQKTSSQHWIICSIEPVLYQSSHLMIFEYQDPVCHLACPCTIQRVYPKCCFQYLKAMLFSMELCNPNWFLGPGQMGEQVPNDPSKLINTYSLSLSQSKYIRTHKLLNVTEILV